MVAISLFIDLDHVAIMAHMNRDAWIEWFRTNHDLDLGHDATWDDIYHSIAVDHIAGGDHGSFVRSQGWDSEYDGPTVGVDVVMTDAERPICEWYALCTNSADGNVSHPVLGPVPTCERCRAKHDMVFMA